MKKTVYLPSKEKIFPTERCEVSNNLILETIVGLKKETNEDSVGCFIHEKSIRICVADGHWGEKASRMIVQQWTNKELEFPTTLLAAQQETKKVESVLYKKFGKPVMNENEDFTPEASFVCVEISDDSASIVSYGDTRLLIANNGELKYQQPCNNTWLGSFSHLGLRGRMPIEQATMFQKIQLQENDHIFLFSDGVDQCIYGKDTISFQKISELSKKPILNDIFDMLFEEIFDHGAEDNASLAIFKYSTLSKTHH